jgi:hypothetical protein
LTYHEKAYAPLREALQMLGLLDTAERTEDGNFSNCPTLT